MGFIYGLGMAVFVLLPLESLDFSSIGDIRKKNPSGNLYLSTEAVLWTQCDLSCALQFRILIVPCCVWKSFHVRRPLIASNSPVQTGLNNKEEFIVLCDWEVHRF